MSERWWPAYLLFCLYAVAAAACVARAVWLGGHDAALLAGMAVFFFLCALHMLSALVRSGQ